jgi:hypothetical protein
MHQSTCAYSFKTTRIPPFVRTQGPNSYLIHTPQRKQLHAHLYIQARMQLKVHKHTQVGPSPCSQPGPSLPAAAAAAAVDAARPKRGLDV